MNGRLIRGLALAVVVACGESAGTSYPIGDASPGIGFDDLRYSTALHRVLVPGGRAGVLALLEPETGEATLIPGFSAEGSYDSGHDFGVTAVDEGRGLLFATDRTAGKVHVVDPVAKAIVASADLGAHPDYVRYVSTTDELWISEPGAAQIEIFALSKAVPPVLTRTGNVVVANGPESLVIDAARGRAYTHHWQSSTVAMDLKSRAIVGEWPNGCAASRGIDLDPEHGYVLVACSEGTVTVLDPGRDGRVLSTMARGSGYDVMGYSRGLRHIYLAGSACSCLTMLGLSAAGQLSYLGREHAPSDTHCAAADDVGDAWLCEPSSGSIRKVADRFPRTL
jgi:hypothetical protein